MGVLATSAALGAGPPSGAPHSLQDLSLALASCPQAGQARASLAPHSSQNLAPVGFSNPQLAQRIGLAPRLRGFQGATVPKFYQCRRLAGLVYQAAARLRAQGLQAGAISIFLHAHMFR